MKKIFTVLVLAALALSAQPIDKASANYIYRNYGMSAGTIDLFMQDQNLSFDDLDLTQDRIFKDKKVDDAYIKFANSFEDQQEQEPVMTETQVIKIMIPGSTMSTRKYTIDQLKEVVKYVRMLALSKPESHIKNILLPDLKANGYDYTKEDIVSFDIDFCNDEIDENGNIAACNYVEVYR